MFISICIPFILFLLILVFILYPSLFYVYSLIIFCLFHIHLQNHFIVSSFHFHFIFTAIVILFYLYPFRSSFNFIYIHILSSFYIIYILF